jgi:hypothetical protein
MKKEMRELTFAHFVIDSHNESHDADNSYTLDVLHHILLSSDGKSRRPMNRQLAISSCQDHEGNGIFLQSTLDGDSY